jgi:ABC-type multidrug transport system ATPase subunit
MSKALIRRQFDPIVEFSGIEEFIDTPVKRYSSGMNARLGFAIAAHLDPEVLIIDEVLAVGDLGFQTKAFNRIREMATSGIPVVIVSHQLDRITELCTKAILLDHGAMACVGTAEECIARYTQGIQTVPDADVTSPVRIHSIRADADTPVRTGEYLGLTVEGVREPGATAEDGDSIRVKILQSQLGHVVFETTSARLGVQLQAGGRFALQVQLQMNVQPGVYRVETAVYSESLAKVISRGPNLHVQVGAGIRFDGYSQLNPRLTLEPGP